MREISGNAFTGVHSEVGADFCALLQELVASMYRKRHVLLIGVYIYISISHPSSIAEKLPPNKTRVVYDKAGVC